jgi:hypothetical protein
MRINKATLNQIIKEETAKLLKEVIIDPDTGEPEPYHVPNTQRQPGIDEWWIDTAGKARHLSDPYWLEAQGAGEPLPWDVERDRRKQLKDDKAVLALQQKAVELQNLRDEFGVQPSAAALRSVPDAGWSRLLKQPAEDLPFHERWPVDQVIDTDEE